MRETTLPLSQQVEVNLATYCPHAPWPKQRFVLDLKAREIFFGGSKGPGKTDLLLMAALRFVHVPGYAALCLRKSTKEARQANSIMDRLQRWTAKTDAKWNLSDSSVRFPSGAMIKFGYVDNPIDATQFQGSEYQLILWDELTQFRLNDDESNPYLYMFGMNRRPELGCHEDLAKVPLQVLSASNPGGISHVWVKDRFVTDEALAAIADPTPRAFYSDDAKTRAFVPARISDNPAINEEQYVRESLSHLPPITRARYISGDWTVQENALIQADWLRYYKCRGEVLEPLDAEGQPLLHAGGQRGIDQRLMTRFATIDWAGTAKDKADEAKGKPRSWSVCQVWDYWPAARFLFLRFQWRDRVEWPTLKAKTAETLKEWNVPRAYIEGGLMGRSLCAELSSVCACETIGPVIGGMSDQQANAKLSRAIASGLFSKLEHAQIYLPQVSTISKAAAWVPDIEKEWLSWTGMEDETADQIDATSYACAVVNDHVETGVIQVEHEFWKRT